jgi:hypothetical protein
MGNLPESKRGNCMNVSAIDSRIGVGSFPQDDDSPQDDDLEFTERGLALMDEWERSTMPTTEEVERFQAGLRGTSTADSVRTSRILPTCRRIDLGYDGEG